MRRNQVWISETLCAAQNLFAVLKFTLIEKKKYEELSFLNFFGKALKNIWGEVICEGNVL